MMQMHVKKLNTYPQLIMTVLISYHFLYLLKKYTDIQYCDKT